MNFDQTLHEVLCEARHLLRPPLSVRMPPTIKSLMKRVNNEGVWERYVSLELVVQIYRDTLAVMNDQERLLLQGKLQETQKVCACIYIHIRMFGTNTFRNAFSGKHTTLKASRKHTKFVSKPFSKVENFP